MPHALVIHAHPYPSRSRAGRALLAALADIDGVTVLSLYDRYPDFDIDVAAEQAALAAATVAIWLHPVYWYAPPGLFKHWLDRVLERGWAYGPGGQALHGKHCLWVPTSGGGEADYRRDGMHAHAFAQFQLPIEQTARFCGMHWEAPHYVLGAHRIDDEALAASAQALATRVRALLALPIPAAHVA